MQLSDLFLQLTSGELSQLKLGGIEGAGIQECDYPKIVPHINLGLTELYKRLPLKISEVVIQQYDHIQLYHLNNKYAETNTESAEPYKYIKDSIYQPFTNNVLRIERIHNELGEELYLNQDESYFEDSPYYYSIHTPSFDTILVPQPEKENQLIVTYRADHDTIVMGKLDDPADIQVPISPSYLEPLLLYVASRMYGNLGSQEGNEGNTYMAKYEASMKRLVDLNLYNKTEMTNRKLEKNGWV